MAVLMRPSLVAVVEAACPGRCRRARSGGVVPAETTQSPIPCSLGFGGRSAGVGLRFWVVLLAAGCGRTALQDARAHSAAAIAARAREIAAALPAEIAQGASDALDAARLAAADVLQRAEVELADHAPRRGEKVVPPRVEPGSPADDQAFNRYSGLVEAREARRRGLEAALRRAPGQAAEIAVEVVLAFLPGWLRKLLAVVGVLVLAWWAWHACAWIRRRFRFRSRHLP